MSETNFAAHVLRHAFSRYRQALQEYNELVKEGDFQYRKDYCSGYLSCAAEMVDWLEREIERLYRSGSEIVDTERTTSIDSGYEEHSATGKSKAS